MRASCARKTSSPNSWSRSTSNRGEIAQNLFNLYAFCKKQLLEANVQKKPELLKRVKKSRANYSRPGSGLNNRYQRRLQSRGLGCSTFCSYRCASCNVPMRLPEKMPLTLCAQRDALLTLTKAAPNTTAEKARWELAR